jgi:hypothetical protein
VTAEFAGALGRVPCRTRDLSDGGLFLEVHHEALEAGSSVTLTLFDDVRGEVVEVSGVIARIVVGTPGQAAGVGVRLIEPDVGWQTLVSRLAQGTSERRPARRLRVLVVGDDARRRGAMALYVKSGWDIRFASDLGTVREALAGFRIDAIVAEVDLDDARWPFVLEEVRRQQPQARRVIRASLRGTEAPPPGEQADLVHRVIDVDAGIDAFVSALTE